MVFIIIAALLGKILLNARAVTLYAHELITLRHKCTPRLYTKCTLSVHSVYTQCKLSCDEQCVECDDDLKKPDGYKTDGLVVRYEYNDRRIIGVQGVTNNETGSLITLLRRMCVNNISFSLLVTL